VFDVIPVVEGGFGHGRVPFFWNDDEGETNFPLCVARSLV
jgi:hypothetical protein